MATLTADPMAPAPVEVVTPLRPSEAMRLGRMLYPMRCEVKPARRRKGGYAVCALGAMAVGYGWVPTTSDDGWNGVAAPLYGRLAGDATCPEGCGDWPRTAYAMTYHLNDYHRWDTGRIADHLEGLGL